MVRGAAGNGCSIHREGTCANGRSRLPANHGRPGGPCCARDGRTPGWCARFGGAGTLIRLGWHPFPLTPALSLREKGNHRLTSWNPTIPVVEWLTVHGQGELPEGSHEYGGTGGRMSIGKSGGGPPHSRTLRAVGWSQAHMAAV